MQKPANLNKAPGVYVLIHDGGKVAYVGNCANIRHRATVWEYNFRKLAEDEDYRMPIKNFPKDLPRDEWQFGGMPGLRVDVVRQSLEQAGYKILNDTTRDSSMVEYKGMLASLAEHARKAGVPYTRAYYRFKAGKPLDEVLSRK